MPCIRTLSMRRWPEGSETGAFILPHPCVGRSLLPHVGEERPDCEADEGYAGSRDTLDVTGENAGCCLPGRRQNVRREADITEGEDQTPILQCQIVGNAAPSDPPDDAGSCPVVTGPSCKPGRPPLRPATANSGRSGWRTSSHPRSPRLRSPRPPSARCRSAHQRRRPDVCCPTSVPAATSAERADVGEQHLGVRVGVQHTLGEADDVLQRVTGRKSARRCPPRWIPSCERPSHH